MKVLWFSHLVPFPATGLGALQRSYHLVRELARKHEVHLLTFVQPKIIGDLLGDLSTGLESARQHLEQYCARVQFLSIPAEQSRLGRPWLAARSGRVASLHHQVASVRGCPGAGCRLEQVDGIRCGAFRHTGFGDL